MKKTILNIMASTGIILLALSFVASLYGGTSIFIDTIFQITLLSILMHLGFLAVRRFDIQSPVLGIVLDISYTMGVTLLLGAVFHWYQNIPLWVLILMVLAIYLTGCLIDLYRTKEEVKVINELLQNRKNKEPKE